MRRLVVVLVLFWGIFQTARMHCQCGFAIVPVAEQHWIRSEGWPIPGLDDAKGFGKIKLATDGKSNGYTFPEGITVSWVAHDKGYVVSFPDAVFDDDGKQKRMLPRKFELYQMLRWEINGKPYAYSYLLGPYDVACTASVDIIDDQGDGSFRVMSTLGHPLAVPPGMNPEPPPLPKWAVRPTSG